MLSSISPCTSTSVAMSTKSWCSSTRLCCSRITSRCRSWISASAFFAAWSDRCCISVCANTSLSPPAFISASTSSMVALGLTMRSSRPRRSLYLSLNLRCTAWYCSDRSRTRRVSVDCRLMRMRASLSPMFAFSSSFICVSFVLMPISSADVEIMRPCIEASALEEADLDVAFSTASCCFSISSILDRIAVISCLISSTFLKKALVAADCVPLSSHVVSRSQWMLSWSFDVRAGFRVSVIGILLWQVK
mmetsp:Transcript_75760/g.202826  ORF Transcript_75760/g.202826 Transcript_75760/m.202826 type:complete len:248 (-) Transcript_75760:132-875(-)